MQASSVRDVYSDGERRFKRHGIDDNPRPYPTRYPHTHTRTDSRTRCNSSCPTIINERALLRSRESKSNTMAHRNHEVELAPWQKLRKKFSREYLKRIEESKQNSQSGGEMTDHLMSKQRNSFQTDIDIPATVVFPPPEQRTGIASESLNTNVYRQCPNVGINFEKVLDHKKPSAQHKFKGYAVIKEEEAHGKVDSGRNEETDLQEMTSMSTIEEHAAEDSYAKQFVTKPCDSDTGSDCGHHEIKVEEKKSSKAKLNVEDKYRQHRREQKSKKMKSHRYSENNSSDSDNVVIEKRKRYSISTDNPSSDSEDAVIEKRKKNSDNSQKKSITTKVEEEELSTTEVNIEAKSDIKCADNSCFESNQERTKESTNKLHKLTRSKTQIIAIDAYDDCCFDRTPTTSVSKLLYELCIKRTTASNMAVVFKFVIFCSVLTWVADSLYYYIQFGNTPQEKFWYEFGFTDWLKLLHGSTIKYVESIVLPVPVK